MNKLTEKAILNRIASGLSSFRIGRYVYFVDSLFVVWRSSYYSSSLSNIHRVAFYSFETNRFEFLI